KTRLHLASRRRGGVVSSVARTAASEEPIIGFLGPGTPSAWSAWTAAFVQRLRELGWIEGRTLAIEYRWAEGSTEHFGEIAAEFVRLKVDVIVTVGGAVLAAKEVTSVIPIVFAAANDPVGHRPRTKPGATGRQRHRPVVPSRRSCRQAARTLARGCPRSAPFGDHVQC